MMPDHFIDDETQEFFGKFGVEIGITGKLAQPGDLFPFARTVSGWQTVFGLILAHGLGNLEPLGQHENQRRIDIVDALAKLVQLFIHGSIPDFRASGISSHLCRTQLQVALFHLPYP